MSARRVSLNIMSLRVSLLSFSARWDAKQHLQGAAKETFLEMFKCHSASFLTADLPFVCVCFVFFLNLFFQVKHIRLGSERGLKGESE